jgi:hypothetical protein
MKPALTRVAVRLPDRQIEYLKAEAARLDLTVSEVLRRLIDDAAGEGVGKAPPPRKGRPT